MIKSAFKDSFGNAGQMRKRLPCLCLRRAVDGSAIASRAFIAYRGKSEEIKLGDLCFPRTSEDYSRTPLVL